MDMHSGGGQKLDWELIFIEAPEKEARVIFYNKFGRSPDRVTCTCCSKDYSYDESKNLTEATRYDRLHRYDDKGEYIPWDAPEKDRKYQSLKNLKETKKSAHQEQAVNFVYKKDITPQDKLGTVPEEGYVWA